MPANSSRSDRELQLRNEHLLLIREGSKIVEGLGKMFAPCCEVLLHDLTQPDNSIVALESPLSDRHVGGPRTEIEEAQASNPEFPDILQNYMNAFPDGRPAKSTSIGLRNSEGNFVASLCLNLDISLFSVIQRVLNQLTATSSDDPVVHKTLGDRSSEGDIRETIETLALQYNAPPHALSPQQRQEVIKLLVETGMLRLRGAVPVVAKVLGISRASVYHALRQGR